MSEVDSQILSGEVPSSSGPVESGDSHGAAGEGAAIAPQAPITRIYVGNLTWDTTDSDLRDYFSSEGSITEVVVSRDNHGKSRGFGFVTFAERESAERAIREKHDLDFKGRKLLVEMGKPQGARRAPRPPREPRNGHGHPGNRGDRERNRDRRSRSRSRDRRDYRDDRDRRDRDRDYRDRRSRSRSRERFRTDRERRPAGGDRERDRDYGRERNDRDRRRSRSRSR